MMRPGHRTAAVVLCLLGHLVSKAVAKTSPEDAATEGKSTFHRIVRETERLAGAVSVANAAASPVLM